MNLTDDRNSKPEAGQIEVTLRSVHSDDLPTFFEFQLDPEANQLAATNPRSPSDFEAHWKGIRKSPEVFVRTILLGTSLAGYVSCFKADGQDCVGYWLGKEFWGQGVASHALQQFLDTILIRPLHARAATTNGASIRVLQKNGFQIIGHEHSAASERFQECDEVILRLDGSKG